MPDLRQPRPLLLLCAVLAVVFLVYAPALGNDFAMDDRHAAMGIDPNGLPRLMIHELEPLPEYFSSHYWRGDHEVDDLFRPVTVLTYALRFQACGDNALVAHLVNILLHVLATFLVYRMLIVLSCSTTASLIGAAAFGIHAVHSEVVVGVVGRAELLAFVFGAGALLYWSSTRHRLPLAVAFTGLLLFLSFCSKESGVVWVPFLFVFQLARSWLSRQQGIPWPEIRRMALQTLLVSVVPLALFLFLRERMLDSLPHPPPTCNFIRNPLAHMDLLERFCMGTYVLGYGLWLCLAPFDLAADYSHAVFPLVKEPTQWRFLVAALVLLSILVGGLWVRRKHPLLFLGMAAFLGFAFLTSNILIVIGTIFGERLYYSPSLGLSFVVAWLWGRSQGRWQQVLSIALGIWAIACAVVILERNPIWRNDTELFRHEVENQPRSAKMQLSAGSTWFEEGDFEKTRHFIKAAIDLEPEYSNAWALLGAFSLDRGQNHEAEEQLKKALTAAYFDRHIDHTNAHANLGKLYLRERRFAEAAKHYESSLRLVPSQKDMFDCLKAMERAGQLREVGQDLETILRRCREAVPYSPYWDGYLGLLAFERGTPGTAIPLLESAVQKIPRDLYGGVPGVMMRLRLADCYLATGRANRVGSLLSGLATPESEEFQKDVAREARKRIHAAFRR